LDQRVKFLLSTLKFTLPAFNRKTSVYLNLLVENFKGLEPQINVNVVQKGIKLIPKGDEAKAENIKKIAVGLMTLILYAIGLIFIYRYFPKQQGGITWSIIASTVSYYLAYGFYYLFLYLKKIL
jgi:hypothetical protein